jgi:hypothetical protein
LKAANLALKFALELGAIAAVAYWGAGVSIVPAIAAPVVVVVLWGTFAAPKSERRLPTRSRVPFELAVFALAAAALIAAGRPVLGAVYAALVVANAALLFAFDQVEA